MAARFRRRWTSSSGTRLIDRSTGIVGPPGRKRIVEAAAPKQLHYSFILALALFEPLAEEESPGRPRAACPPVCARTSPDQLDGGSCWIRATAARFRGVAHNRQRARRLRAASRGAARRLLGRGVV